MSARRSSVPASHSVHPHKWQCDVCGTNYSSGQRYRCAICADWDECEHCIGQHTLVDAQKHADARWEPRPLDHDPFTHVMVLLRHIPTNVSLPSMAIPLTDKRKEEEEDIVCTLCQIPIHGTVFLCCDCDQRMICGPCGKKTPEHNMLVVRWPKVAGEWIQEPQLWLQAAVSSMAGTPRGVCRTSSSSHFRHLEALNSERTLVGFSSIEWEELMMGQVIGKGSYGVVRAGVYLGSPVAIKEIKKDKINDAGLVLVARELDLLQSVRHPNIVSFLGSVEHQKSLFIVMPLIAGGSVRELIKTTWVNRQPLSWRFRVGVALDIARAMGHLHSQNIVHRDLKCSNVLLDVKGKALICDFGFARRVTLPLLSSSPLSPPMSPTLGYVGSEQYMAPEILVSSRTVPSGAIRRPLPSRPVKRLLRRNRRHTFDGFRGKTGGEQFDAKAADIFSFGIVLCDLLTRRRAGRDGVHRVAPHFVVDEEELGDLAEAGHPPGLLEMTMECLHALPQKRPSFDVITKRLVQLLEPLQFGADAGAAIAATLHHRAQEMGRMGPGTMVQIGWAEDSEPSIRSSSLLFCDAARDGRTRALLSLLAKEDVNQVDDHGHTGLWLASRSGQDKVVELLASHSAQDVPISHAGQYAVHAAALGNSMGQAQVIYVLGRCGYDVNVLETRGRGRTALGLAAGRGHHNVVHALLRWFEKNGDDNQVNALDGHGWSALHHASSSGHAHVVEMLLEGGADPNIVFGDGSALRPLHLAVAGEHADVIKALLHRGALLTMEKEELSPVHVGAECASVATIQVLLEESSLQDVNCRQQGGVTPLILAAKRRDTDVLSLFLSKGADSSMLTERGKNSALHFSCKEGVLASVELLSDVCKTMLNARNANGATPAHFAAKQGHVLVLEMLEAKGADLWIVDKQERVPLHYAALRGRWDSDVGRFLRKSMEELGFDMEGPKDMFGKSPMELAFEKSEEETSSSGGSLV